MKRRRRVVVVNGVLVILLLLAGWAGYRLLWPDDSADATSGVRTTAVTTTDVAETVSAAGTVESAYTGTANFRTSGTVSTIDVKVGSVVTKGQTLATLDSVQAVEQVEVAQANLDVAEEDLDNAGSSATTSTTSGQSGQGTQQQQQESTTSLQAKVDQAQLTLDQAQQTVDDTTLTAPGAGTVTAVNGAVGDQAGSSSGSGSGSSAVSGSSAASGSGSSSTASTSSGFVVITDMAHLTVHASVAEIDVSKVKTGQTVAVTVNALPDSPVTGTVSQVDLTPTTSNNVVSYGVTLKLTKAPSGLRPGQSASVAITVAKADGALAVPAAAVRTVTDSGTSVSSVTVLVNGQQETRTIEVGVRSEALVQVTSGLDEGDQVVLAATTTTANQTGTGRGGGAGGGGFGGGAGGFGGGTGGGFGGAPGGGAGR
jgi:macrolide-specific efflux system membrane fusion protein